MNFSVYKMVFLAVALGVIGATTVLAGTPYPAAGTPKAVDRGLLTEQAGAGAISVTIALKLRDPEGAETLLRRLNTPGDERFHKFLTTEQFQAEFGRLRPMSRRYAQASVATA